MEFCGGGSMQDIYHSKHSDANTEIPWLHHPLTYLLIIIIRSGGIQYIGLLFTFHKLIILEAVVDI